MTCNKNQYQKDLGERLFAYMIREELSIFKLAEGLCIGRQAIERLFSSEVKTELRYSTLAKIHNFLKDKDA